MRAVEHFFNDFQTFLRRSVSGNPAARHNGGMNDFEESFEWYPPLMREVPIPPIFHSLQAGGPFERCLICETELLAEGVAYSIEIVYRQREPIIEMAICDPCRGNLSSELSEESTQAIERYVSQRVDFFDRQRTMATVSEEQGIDPWLDHCLATGQARGDCAEWQICGMFVGDKMQLGAVPLMLSGAAAEEMSELLSEKTKGWMQDFIGEHFGMPPEFCDSPDWHPLLI